MGAMCKFDFSIGCLCNAGEYVMFKKITKGMKGLRVKVYTTPRVGTP